MLKGDENHDISITEASQMTARYRATISTGDKIGGLFGGNVFSRILAQDGCKGIRYYYGLNEENKKVLILVGVTKDEKDITDGIIAEASFPCPNRCSDPNILNSDI